jgi:hypothetical protein
VYYIPEAQGNRELNENVVDFQVRMIILVDFTLHVGAFMARSELAT